MGSLTRKLSRNTKKMAEDQNVSEEVLLAVTRNYYLKIKEAWEGRDPETEPCVQAKIVFASHPDKSNDGTYQVRAEISAVTTEEAGFGVSAMRDTLPLVQKNAADTSIIFAYQIHLADESPIGDLQAGFLILKKNFEQEMLQALN